MNRLAPVFLCSLWPVISAADEGDLKHPDWHPAGERLIAEGSCNGNIGLYLIDAAVGSVQLVLDSEHVDGYPRWFANGKQVAFHQVDNNRVSRIFVSDISKDGEALNIRRITDGPFDIEPAPSPDGTQLAFSSAGQTGQDIAVINLANRVQKSWATPAAENFPSWHPDGDVLLFHAREGDETQLYTRSISTDELRQITQTGSPNMVGHFGPDGAQLVFSSERSGDREIYLRNLTSQKETRITARAGRDGYPKFSPDGARIAHHSTTEDGRTSIRILELASGQFIEITCANWQMLP